MLLLENSKTRARPIASAWALATLTVMLSALGARAQGLPTLHVAGGTEDKPAVVNWASAPVEVNGTVLFRRYAENPDEALMRAEVTSLRLEEVVDQMGEDQPPEVSVRDVGSGVVEVIVGDRSIATITNADTQATAVKAGRLGEMWAHEIRRALSLVRAQRQPDFYKKAIAFSAGWLALALVLVSLLSWLHRRWSVRAGWPAQVVIWGLALSRGLWIWPQTRLAFNYIVHGPPRPLVILATVSVTAMALARFWSSILHHLFPMNPEELTVEERTERAYQRRSTLAAVSRITGVTVIWIIALLAALTWAGVNLPALIASAGLLGVAVGLAAQDSMKDIVSGVNILVDDRFGVGDFVEVNGHSGSVERLNLRITQIRNINGELITIPNREVVSVINKTSRWSQVDMQMRVAYHTDLSRAMETMLECAREVGSEFPDKVLDEPNMLGVDSFGDSSITLRMLWRTPPGDQWFIARQLRLRIKRAFDEAGIEIPFPQREVRMRGERKDV